MIDWSFTGWSLELLTEWGCGVGPRLLGVDDQLHVILLEDLGSGPAVEDLLVDRDRSAAIGALHDHARTLATLQSASLGHADVFYQRLEANGLARAQDRGVVQIMPFSQRWQGLRAIVDARPYLPSPARAERDIERILNWLENPGPFLTLSNGDFKPQNSRLVGGRRAPARLRRCPVSARLAGCRTPADPVCCGAVLESAPPGRSGWAGDDVSSGVSRCVSSDHR